jgi:enoyl-CoA hydratase/carnithine racemase
MYNEIIEALRQAENDPKVVFCCLIGKGKFFSSGNDLKNYINPLPEAFQDEDPISIGVNLCE